MNGIQIASSLVKCDLDEVCPLENVERSISTGPKKQKLDGELREYTLCRPFRNDINSVKSYLQISPKCVELLNLLKHEVIDIRWRALAMIGFVMSKVRDHTDVISGYILDNFNTLLQHLYVNDDVMIYYLLDVLIESIKVSSVDKIRYFVNSIDFYGIFGKHHVTTHPDLYSTLTSFYKDLLDRKLIKDIGLTEDYCSPPSKFDLYFTNGKKKLCLLLLVGLKGFNIFNKNNTLRLIFDHVKNESLINNLVILYLVILVLLSFLNKYSNRIALDLNVKGINLEGNKTPSPIIEHVSSSLSHLLELHGKRDGSNIQDVKDGYTVSMRTLYNLIEYFLNMIENYCDVGTFVNIALKFDICKVSNIIFGIITKNHNFAKLYLPKVKYRYDLESSYLLLVKFSNDWFTILISEYTHLSESECLSLIPSFVNKHFFNNGLLSKRRKVVHVTLQLLSNFITFIRNCNFEQNKSTLVPDFKTLVNSRSGEKDVTNEMSINVKADGVNDGFGSTDEKALLTEWLLCLYKYGSFILDNKNVYDPTKLLRDDIILNNSNKVINFLSEYGFDNGSLSSGRADGSPRPSARVCLSGDGQRSDREEDRILGLDMAVIDCLYYLALKDGISIMSRVQITSLEYIIQRFQLLNSMSRSVTLSGLCKDYYKKCYSYLLEILRVSDLFAKPLELWINNLFTKDVSNFFLYAFTTCVEKPLDVLFGLTLASVENKQIAKFKCTNCILGGKTFGSSPILKFLLDTLIHFHQGTRNNFLCLNCNTHLLNIIAILCNKYQGLNLESIVTYIKGISAALLESDFKEGILEIFNVLNLQPESISLSEAVITDGDNRKIPSAKDKIKDVNLNIYSTLLSHLHPLDDTLFLNKIKSQIIIDVLNVKITRRGKAKRTSLRDVSRFDFIFDKWSKYVATDYIRKCIAMETPSLKAHLFLFTSTLLSEFDVSYANSISKLLKSKHDIDMLFTFNISMRLDNTLQGDEFVNMVSDQFKNFYSNYKRLSQVEFNEKLTYLSRSLEFLSLDQISASFTFEELKRILLDIQVCNGCNDLMNCSFNTMMYCFDICSFLLKGLDIGLCVRILQADWVYNYGFIISRMNDSNYFIGDVIEVNLFLSYLKFISGVLKRLISTYNVVYSIKKRRICRLFDILSSCYKCSYENVDILLKEIIYNLITLTNGLIQDKRSAFLKLPQFHDFIYTNEPDVHTHGRGWIHMTKGVPLKAIRSNWLYMNNLRINSTLYKFPTSPTSSLAQEDRSKGSVITNTPFNTISHFSEALDSTQQSVHRRDNTSIPSSLSVLSILYPPVLVDTFGSTDVLFGSIVRLNEALGVCGRSVQNYLVPGPYIYDVEYLLKYITGRLCLSYHSQLVKYKLEFAELFEKLNTTHYYPPPLYIYKKDITIDDVNIAAVRLQQQLNSLSDIDPLATYNESLIKDCTNNGILELCILGLLNEDTKDTSNKALGLLAKIIQNSIDRTILNSASFDYNTFKLKKFEYKDILHVQSLLYFIQRSQNESQNVPEEVESADSGLATLSQGDRIQEVGDTGPSSFSSTANFEEEGTSMMSTGDGEVIQGHKSAVGPAMLIIFGFHSLRRLLNPEDGIYRLVNRRILKFKLNLRDVPLFYDCFIPQEANTRENFISFILTLLETYSRFLHDYDLLGKRHVMQQLLSFSLVETNYEFLFQIVTILLHSSEKIFNELTFMGLPSWICNVTSTLNKELEITNSSNTVVWITLLLLNLTKLVINLTDGKREPAGVLHTLLGGSREISTQQHTTWLENDDIPSLMRLSALHDALHCLARAWLTLLERIPINQATNQSKLKYLEILVTIKHTLNELRGPAQINDAITQTIHKIQSNTLIYL